MEFPVTEMSEINTNRELALKEREDSLAIEVLSNGTGNHRMVPTKNLDIAKLVTNEQRVEEEKFLEGKETQIQNRYRGVRGYLRLFQITRVIASLSLYLYLDQLDIHQKQQTRHKNERLSRSYRLTRLAVYCENLYSIRIWFFQQFMKLVRRFVIGAERDRERNQ